MGFRSGTFFSNSDLKIPVIAVDTVKAIKYLTKAKEFYEAEKYDSASSYFLKTSWYLKKSQSWNSYANCLLTAAKSYTYINKLNKAIIISDTIEVIAKKHLDDKDPVLANLRFLKGIIYSKKKNYSKSIENIKSAIEIRKHNHNNSDIVLASWYKILGHNYYDLREFNKSRYDDALNCYNNTIQIQMQSYGNKRQEIAECYNDMGIVCHLKKDYNKAIENYNISLKTLRELYGSRHHEYAKYYSNLALVYLDKKSFNTALNKIDLATENYKKYYDEKSNPVFAKSKYIKGLIYFGMEDYDYSLKHFEEAQAIWEQHSHEYCRNIVNCYEYIALIYTVKGKNKSEFKYFELEDNYRDSCYKWNKFERSNFYVYHSYKNIYLINGYIKKYKNSLNTIIINKWKLKFNKIPEIIADKDYHGRKEYDKQLADYEKIIPVQHRSLGEQEHSIAKQLNDQGVKDVKNEYYDNALGNFQKALDVGIQSVEDLFPALAKSKTNKKQYANILDFTREKLKKQYDSLGDNHLEVAESYNDLGLIFNKTGQYDTALHYFQKSLEIRHDLLDNKNQYIAESYNNIGIIYNKKGDYNNALYYFEKAGEIEETQSINTNTATISQSYNNIGIILDKKEDYVKALKSFQKALAIKIKSFGEKNRTVSNSYIDIGMIFSKKGDFNEALIAFYKALEIRKESLKENDPSIAESYRNIGKTYNQLGNHDTALSFFEKALAIEQESLGNNSPVVAGSYSDIGKIYTKKKDFNSAINAFRKSLKINIQSLGEKNPVVADSYTSLGNVYSEIENYKKALGFHDKALEIRKASFGQNHLEIAKSYNEIGSIYKEQKDYESALINFQKAIIANTPGFDDPNTSHNPKPDNSLSKLYLTEILKNKAQTFFELYKEKTKSNKDLDMALNTYDLTIDILSRINTVYKTKEACAQIDLQTEKAFSEAISVAFESNQKMAFEFAEKSKSIKFLSSILDFEVIKFANVPDSIQISAKDLKKDLSLLNKYIETEQKKENPNFDKIDFWQKKINLLTSEYDKLKAFIKENHPDYYRLIYDHDVIDIKTLQNEHLTKKNALIEYKLTDSLLYIFTTTRKKFKVEKISIDSIFYNSLNLIRSSLANVDLGHHTHEDFNNYVNAANHLYSKLIKPQEKYIKGKNLIIIPDDQLNYISFDALLTKKPEKNKFDYRSLPYLIRKYPISYSSLSASFLFDHYNLHQKPTGDKVIAFAPSYESVYQSKDNRYKKTLIPIPAVKDEVRSISKEINADVYEGTRATKSNFIEHSHGYNVLHLAMHTLIFDENPMYSQLAFAPDIDSMEKSFLNVYEIFNLKLNASMAVLSACNTGYGALKEGEGIISLTGGFLYAGVPSVIITLWPVQDKSSAILMQKFYHYLSKGKRKDKALQMAKIDYLRKADPLKVHPYFWAAYINLGDSSSIIQPAKIKHYILLSLIVIVTLCGLILLRRRK